MFLVKQLFSIGFACWFALAQVLFGMSAAFAQTGSIDVEPPLIEHDVVSAVEAGVRQTFFASVVDDNELDSVSLFYRFQKDPVYSSVLMKRISYSSTYIAHIPTDPTSDRNIEYYIQARDKAGNRTVRGYAFNPLLREIKLAESPAVAETSPVADAAPSAEKRKTLLYVALGVLVLGLAASAAAAGGGGNPEPGAPCPEGVCTITVTVGRP